jgi:hypothetical protein
VALALRDWLPNVLQSIDPYVSTEDVEKGARWNAEVGRALDEISYGVLCVTRQNLDSRWLNFEAGALSKSIDSSRVSPFLIDLRPAELVGPLSQFQATMPQSDEVHRLAKSMNAASERPIDDARLTEAVTMWWPRLEAEMRTVISDGAEYPHQPQRESKEMIEELLEITRGIQRRLVSGELGDLATVIESVLPRRETLSARNRGSAVDRVAQDVRAALNQFRVSTGSSVKISATAITVIFDTRPSNALMGILTAIADHHGFSLYTYVNESNGDTAIPDTSLHPGEDDADG